MLNDTGQRETSKLRHKSLWVLVLPFHSADRGAEQKERSAICLSAEGLMRALCSGPRRHTKAGPQIGPSQKGAMPSRPRS